MLRDAHDGDVEEILRMRNQPANREVSTTNHEIGPAEHLAWWRRAQADPSRKVLIYSRGDRPAGVVNFFDLEPAETPRGGAWGFFLDAEALAATGETVPAWIEVMREATSYAFDTLGLEQLTGEVLASNTVVRQMNRRFRFTEGPPEDRFVDGREVTVYPLSLHRADRRPTRRKAASSNDQDPDQED